MSHWLLSCYACGQQLRYPSKVVQNPLCPLEQVSVCSGHCGAVLYRLKIKMDRNDAAIEAALRGGTYGRPESR